MRLGQISVGEVVCVGGGEMGRRGGVDAAAVDIGGGAGVGLVEVGVGVG